MDLVARITLRGEADSLMGARIERELYRSADGAHFIRDREYLTVRSASGELTESASDTVVALPVDVAADLLARRRADGDAALVIITGLPGEG